MRQAYDYWQDQPGNFFVSTTQPAQPNEGRAGRARTHTKGSKSSQGVIETKNSKNSLHNPVKGRLFFFGISVSFTTEPIVRSDSETPAQGRHATSRRTPFCADCESLKDQAQPKGSGPSVTDLQISPDYVYPSGMHTDSFNLSAELAMSLADNRNRGPGALRKRKDCGHYSFHPTQLNTQLGFVRFGSY